jgi:hypothetical protein
VRPSLGVTAHRLSLYIPGAHVSFLDYTFDDDDDDDQADGGDELSIRFAPPSGLLRLIPLANSCFMLDLGVDPMSRYFYEDHVCEDSRDCEDG